ncbi:glycoside hydrolase family 19 protein [Enterobacter soli]|uniref:glycoside hydrolase family 19 protein n=1 Tax=Enterobacter soli TaxID=885040 RepID=UPI003EDA90C0
MNEITLGTALPALILCGMAGMVGQGIRAIVGLRKAGYLQIEAGDSKQNFSASYLMVTLMIGFIAGSLSGLTMGLDTFAGKFPTESLMAVVAAGYAGVDFIEGSFNSRIKSAVSPYIGPDANKTDAGGTAGSADTGNATASAPVPSPPPQPAPAPASASTIPPQSPLGSALKQVSPRLNIDIWAPALANAFTHYELHSDRRIAAAVGQFMVEAGSTFSELEENLRYTTLSQLMKIFGNHFKDEQEAELFLRQPVKLANRVYANRLGNGDEASGDGYRYRGRGLIQLTGKSEYQEFAEFINMPVEEAAEWCKTPEGAAVSGCWYLKTRNCLPLADDWDLVTLTERVNGKAKVNLEERIAFSKSMLKALS